MIRSLHTSGSSECVR